MKFKFLDALLHIAVALSFIDWSNRSEVDRSAFSTLAPSSILPGPIRDYGPTRPSNGAFTPSIATTKEEDNIIDSIINWEENQRLSRLIQNANLTAYPIVSQSPTLQNYSLEPNSFSTLHSNSLENGPIIGSSASLESSSSHNSWPSSPGSSFDDGELFGAVGYTPQSGEQYFDIESFLDGSFSSTTTSPFENDGSTAISDELVGPSWMDGSTVPSETVEELAEFLKASIESPEPDEFAQKAGFPSINQNYPEYLQENLNDMEINKQIPMQASLPGIALDKNRIANLGDIISDEFHNTKAKAAKGDPFPAGQSYDSSQKIDQKMLHEEKLNQRMLSPFEDYLQVESQSKRFPFKHDIEIVEKQFHDKLKQKTENEELKGCKKVWDDLPYTRDEIIEMDIEKFNNLISSLNPLQQHIGKDVRRRGKNKLAARNCRKRKVDNVDYLEKVVEETEKQKQKLLDEKLMLQEEMAEIKRKTSFLYDHIFKNLQDEEGLPYSHEKFALAYTAEGSVYLVPKTLQDKEEVNVR